MNGLQTHFRASGSASTTPERGSWKPTRYMDTTFAFSGELKSELKARHTAVIATQDIARSAAWTGNPPGNLQTNLTNTHIHTP